MPRQILLFFALSCFLSSSVSAQQRVSSVCPCSVEGTAIDSVNGAPIDHALVHVYGEGVHEVHPVFTSSGGKFSFHGLDGSAVSFQLTKPGYVAPGLEGPMAQAMESFPLSETLTTIV